MGRFVVYITGVVAEASYEGRGIIGREKLPANNLVFFVVHTNSRLASSWGCICGCSCYIPSNFLINRKKKKENNPCENYFLLYIYIYIVSICSVTVPPMSLLCVLSSNCESISKHWLQWVRCPIGIDICPFLVVEHVRQLNSIINFILT